MDILTLELYDVTVSEALREISRVLTDHPGLPLRILTAGDEMLLHKAYFDELVAKSGQTKTPTLDIDGEILADSDREAVAKRLGL